MLWNRTRLWLAAGVAISCGQTVELGHGRGGGSNADSGGGSGASGGVAGLGDGAVPGCRSEFEWGSIHRIAGEGSPGTFDGSQTSVSVDADGNAWVTWTGNGGQESVSGVWAARFDAAAERWESPTRLFECAYLCRALSAFDERGAGVAVVAGDQLLRSRVFDPAAGAWRAETSLGVSDVSLNALCDVAIRGDRAAVVWRQADASGDALFSRDVWASEAPLASAPWTNRRLTLDGSSAMLCGASVAIDVAPRYVVPKEQGMFAFRFDSATDSYPEERVSERGVWAGDAQIAAASDGTAVAVWREDTDPFGPGFTSAIWANEFDGAWRGPQKVAQAATGHVLMFPKVAVGANGGAIAAWFTAAQWGDFAGATVWVAVYDSAAREWTEQVAVDGVGSAAPDVAMDGAGNGFVAWYRDDMVFSRRYDALTGKWGLPALMDTRAAHPEATGVFGHARIGASVSGYAFAAWSTGVTVRRYACPD